MGARLAKETTMYAEEFEDYREEYESYDRDNDDSGLGVDTEAT